MHTSVSSLLIVCLALLGFSIFTQAASLQNDRKLPGDAKLFKEWFPTGGKCVMTGPGLWLCKTLPKQDSKRILNGTCVESGPYYISCGPDAQPFDSTTCVPSGPGVYRCGREDLLVDKFYCLEAWEGVHRCAEDKPLANLPKVPGALGG